MAKYAFQITLFLLLVNLMSTAQTAHAQVSGNLVVSGNRTVTIEDTGLRVTGVIVRDTSMLIIRRATLEVAPAGDYSSLVRVEGEGKLLLEEGRISQRSHYTTIYLTDHANLTAARGSEVVNDPGVLASDGQSTITLIESSLQVTILRIGGSSLYAQGARIEARYGRDPRFGGKLEPPTVRASRVQLLNTAVNQGSGEAIVVSGAQGFQAVDSTLRKLVLEGRTPAGLYNVAVAEIYVKDTSVASIYWLLTASVRDRSGGGVSGARISVAHYLSGEEVFVGVTDQNGVTRIFVLSRTVRPYGETFLGNYRVRAQIDGRATPWLGLTMDWNREVHLDFEEYLGNHTLVVETSVPKLEVDIDDRTYVADEKGTVALTFPGIRGFHTVRIPSLVSAGDSVRRAFVGWRDGVIANLRSADVLNTTLHLAAAYRTQYRLDVASSYGNVTGGGWYDEDSLARFSVSPTSVDQGWGVTVVFVAWEGDSVSRLPSASIRMTGPKRVIGSWNVDRSGQNVLALIVLLLVLIASVPFWVARRLAHTYEVSRSSRDGLGFICN